MRRIILATFFLICTYTNAQRKEKSIQFNLTYNNQPLQLHKNYLLASKKDSIKIETLRFFISNIQFSLNKKVVTELQKKYHLIDSEKPNSQHITFLHNSDEVFNTIKFNIGIDSITNVSGVFGGDLDPTNGMYWTWQSGYINFKLEGKSANCQARNNVFQFHLGGYQFPANTIQSVELEIKNLEEIIINIALNSFLDEINLAETYTVLSPNKTAMSLAELLPTMFSIQDEN